MTRVENCIFCKIATKEAPSHTIWEDENYIAFLSIFPNTKGFSVVIPKAHCSSYLFDLPDDVMTGLVQASKKVAKLLDEKLPDVGRTAMIFEGFGVNHLHAKMFPMHGTKADEWTERTISIEKYFDTYEGYISSHDYKRADDVELAALARKIRGEI